MRSLADRYVELGAVIDQCHARGLDVVMYYCTVYVDWYWDHHPEARIVDAEGKSQKLLMGKPARPPMSFWLVAWAEKRLGLSTEARATEPISPPILLT